MTTLFLAVLGFFATFLIGAVLVIVTAPSEAQLRDRDRVNAMRRNLR